MSADYIVIAGQRYRVEVNWNAIVAFLEDRGTDRLDALAELGKISVKDIAPLMAACIREGERLDGRECTLTALELGALPGFMDVIPMFLRIYGRQAAPGTGEAPKEEPGKKE